MIRLNSALLLIAALSLPNLVPAVAQASTEAKPEAALKRAFPQLTVDRIVPSEIPGVYEVTSGANIFYYYPDKELVVIGDIYTKDQRNITAEKKRDLEDKKGEQIWAREGKNLPLEKGVKIGSGKNVVIEFTDPDCPYCRKASEFLGSRTDVTRYVFFAPLAHPAAITKIHYILNAKDKAKAYEEMMQGKNPEHPAGGYSDAIKALGQEHLELAKKFGVAGTPTFYVNGKPVVGADFRKIESLLRDQAGK